MPDLQPHERPVSDSPWARDDKDPSHLDDVIIPGRRKTGAFSRAFVDFVNDAPYAKDPKMNGVPPPGYFGNGWEHPSRNPSRNESTQLPYGVEYNEPPVNNYPTEKPNHIRPTRNMYPDKTGLNKQGLMSTGLAFFENRPAEKMGMFSDEARQKYLGELKEQMDAQKADMRMKELKHWGWDVGDEPKRHADGFAFPAFLNMMAGRMSLDMDKDALRDIFAQFDRDQSGNITHDELKHVVKNLDGTGFISPSELRYLRENIDDIIADIDKDGDGEINYGEFVDMMIHLKEQFKQQDMRELFRTFDKDNSGSITAAEPRKAVSQLDGIGLMSVMEQREMMENLDAMINEADTDGDGTVDYEEFVAMMTKMNEAKAAA